MLPLLVTLLIGCWRGDAYILEGTVLEVRDNGQVLVDHEAVDGLMGPMVMPFHVADPALLEGVTAGDRIVARLIVDDREARLAKIRVTGHPGLPTPAADGPAPVHAGEAFPRTEVPVDGGTWIVGPGQERPTALAFLYTTCPIPEFCPMLASRLQALQAAVGTDARILAVTIDPEHDTAEVLRAYGEKVGADPAIWRFGRLEQPALQDLALRAALPIAPDGERITHGLRLLVLDRDGRLVERYDDNDWPLDRVVQQLRTGGPPAPAGSDGTISRPPTP